MQRIKRPFLWLMMAAMLLTMIPNGFTQPTAAALSSTTYFSPDDLDLRATISLSQTTGSLTRDTAYVTTSSTLSITGTYSLVTASSMSVTVEQLTQSGTRWVTDSNYVTTGTVTTDSANSSTRFVTTALPLYSGYNKITFSGIQGSLTRSESFYVLYDKVPYISAVKVLSGSTTLNLNEGTQIVVSRPSVTIQGVVANATKVTISLNGGTSLQTSLLEDGTFYTPSLTLASGINTIRLVVQNASDSITVDRSLYYFDTTQPFTELNIVHPGGSSGTTYDLMDEIPTLAEDSTVAHLTGQVLVPYNSTTFASGGTMTINGTATTVTVNSEVVIPDSDGVTSAYRLVSFTTGTYTISTDVNQSVTLALKYGDLETSIKKSFKYLPNEVIIKNIYHLSGYSSGTDLSNVTQAALNGKEVESSDFYILVETNKAPTTDLVAHYLPLSSSTVQLSTPTTISSTQYVYKVTGFSNGQQQVRFQYTNSASYFNVSVTYVSKNYIYVENLIDGQTYTFDSSQTNTMKISGKYIGFESIDSAQYFINGISGDNLESTAGADIDLDVDINKTNFELNLNITASGPLVYGENKIVFTGVSTDSAGNTRTISKSLAIYIIDENTSNITQFHPSLTTTRATMDQSRVSNYTDAQLSNILDLTSDFVYKDGQFTTSEDSYDLVIRAGGATSLNLYQGTTTLFSTADIEEDTGTNLLNIDGTYNTINNSHFDAGNGNTYYYDFSGNTNDFILRIRDISFGNDISQTFNLELLNSTGAKTTLKIVVAHESSAYRLLSPVATVGNQIVVNKNFVRFDIEAEGADKVTVGGNEATLRGDLENRYVYDYVGLKADKANTIKIVITTGSTTITDSVTVYYSSTIQVDSQYMAEKTALKYSVFNKAVTLTLPKTTVMKGYTTSGSSKLYPDKKLLFGIADPNDGVVERVNDYGNTINVDLDARTTGGLSSIQLPSALVLRFNSTANTSNFSLVSDIYWISGGLGEKTGVSGSATNGIAPYSVEGYFTQYDSNRKIVPSLRGSLTLAYDSNLVTDTGATVTVFRYTDEGIWENIGGEANTANHTITVPFDEFGYYKVMKLSKGYTDITNHSWARNILNGLYAKGIMVNLQSTLFGADDTTTRGEFATLLVKGLNIPLNYDEDDPTFYDVVPAASATTWDFEHIETAARAGIITGLSDGYFAPTRALTREQAAVMIARALELKVATNDAKLLATLTKSFADAGSINYYARPSVQVVAKAGIMEGAAVTSSTSTLYNFNPASNLTRAEAGKITVALLKKSTGIFPKTLN